jgi:cytochrome c oxidase subunit 7
VPTSLFCRDFVQSQLIPQAQSWWWTKKYFLFQRKNPLSSLYTQNLKMIAPITGKFRKQVVKDIAISLVLGAAGGAAWWNLYHIPKAAQRDAYYAKLEASKQ